MSSYTPFTMSDTSLRGFYKTRMNKNSLNLGKLPEKLVSVNYTDSFDSFSATVLDGWYL